jgi:hypothetical protein
MRIAPPLCPRQREQALATHPWFHREPAVPPKPELAQLFEPCQSRTTQSIAMQSTAGSLKEKCKRNMNGRARILWVWPI